jgi:hypothetical protein
MNRGYQLGRQLGALCAKNADKKKKRFARRQKKKPPTSHRKVDCGALTCWSIL